MAVRKQIVSFTESAFAFAQSLVDSGEMVRAKAARDAQATLLSAEVERRLALPLDQWEPVGELSEITAKARVELARLRQEHRRQAHDAP